MRYLAEDLFTGIIALIFNFITQLFFILIPEGGGIDIKINNKKYNKTNK